MLPSFAGVKDNTRTLTLVQAEKPRLPVGAFLLEETMINRLILAAVLCGAALCAHASDLTGLWSDPKNSGHGLSVHAWEQDGETWLIALWFAHEQTGSTWLLFDNALLMGGSAGPSVLYWPQSNDFPVAHSVVMYKVGTAVLSETATGINLKYDVLIDCGLQPSPVPPWCGKFADSQGSIDLTRLTPQ